MNSTEIVNVTETSVSCCGTEAPFDHPRIYFEIDPDVKIASCPYCSKKFILIGK